MNEAILAALMTFADSVKAKFSAAAAGEPEAQLSGPVSHLIEVIGRILSRTIVAKAESRLGDRLGIPDFGVLADGVLCGYLEVKAPGEGADTKRYKGRNKEQWQRFRSQPNLVYTDGQEWALYQNGEAAEKVLVFSKDITKHGSKAISLADAELFRSIITRFFGWTPKAVSKPKEQAALLAPLCRLLRDDVADAIRDSDSPLVKLAVDWRSLLFPDATDERFADAYAQTVTFALLLAHTEGADISELRQAIQALEGGHTLLSRALLVLTDAKARREIEPSLRLLQRVIGVFPVGGMLPDESDPWLYFYEYFLSEYDPKLRKDSGVYYTPVEVVRCQVALVDQLLREELDKSNGFAHKGVLTLDPAVGTGTYLLGVIEQTLARVGMENPGMVPGAASELARNLFGLEIMVGPYAVSELRITRAIKDRGGSLDKDGLQIYLADTLESHTKKPPPFPQFLEPLAEQHAKAIGVKDKKEVIVCLGNPPYDRHEKVGEETQASRARSGSWVRWADSGNPDHSIFNDFVEPALIAGHGGDVKNLYNLYLYFIRWAVWKVFEHSSSKKNGGGIVSFITAASYLRGDAFVGVRELFRKLCHEVYIIDLGGEGRGTRQDENVFNILTPVAICIAVGKGEKNIKKPAKVRYVRIAGTREEKLAQLGRVTSFKNLKWKTCPAGWHDPFRPKGTGAYFKYPKLTDMMPWQQSGVKVGRLWPIGPSEEVLSRRWKKLVSSDSESRPKLFKNSPTGKNYRDTPLPLRGSEERLVAIHDLTKTAPAPTIVRYAYRAFDRQYLFEDARLLDRAGPAIWSTESTSQIYFCSLFTQALGSGPGLISSIAVPDLDNFRGSFGAKAILPLYRDAEATEPNIAPGLLELWGSKLKRVITPEHFAAYLYSALAHPDFVERFYDELEDCEVRVPLTLSGSLFDRAMELGEQLLFLHTYGERCTNKKRRKGQIPRGSARNTIAISDRPEDYPDEFHYLAESQTLRVGAGVISSVAPEVWNYEVSGLHIVKSWLGYRMKNRKGRKSSPLDDIHPERWTNEFTEELLKLLWILEATIAMHGDLAKLLGEICEGPLLLESELPPVPERCRSAPKAGSSLFDPENGHHDED